jgi:hypothetical protein
MGAPDGSHTIVYLCPDPAPTSVISREIGGGNATVNVYNYKWQGYVCDTLHYYDYTANRTRTVCFSIHL